MSDKKNDLEKLVDTPRNQPNWSVPHQNDSDEAKFKRSAAASAHQRSKYIPVTLAPRVKHHDED